ncbi:RNA polymerase sigma factor [Merismopedia glauca]|uniref:Uncharacterized protein n=1 Tax=Merismopedia glauca CCAP 1448/3 TaxID=1296344 RepID=A0A2T1BY58_9CYAN|nr:sigma-70 family RNA polymerase sigma factor [Merismopedia glauca]PSB00874.1 hypothetical protein C7B64_21275 [Merismopedia glauca CCAP 1448/3]
MDDSINLELYRLLQQALEHSAGSQQSDLAAESLSLLVAQSANEVENSFLPEIVNFISPGLRPYITKAITTTQKDIRQNIHKFPSSYSLNLDEVDIRQTSDLALVRLTFIKWIVTILKSDCIDEYRKTKRQARQVKRETSLNTPIGDGTATIEDTVSDPTLVGLETIIKAEIERATKRIGTQIRDIISQDPRDRLKSCYPKNQDSCNCQILLKLYLIDRLTMREIAERLNSSEGTVRNYLTYFPHKQRKSCINLIREIAQELGFGVEDLNY